MNKAFRIDLVLYYEDYGKIGQRYIEERKPNILWKEDKEFGDLIRTIKPILFKHNLSASHFNIKDQEIGICVMYDSLIDKEEDLLTVIIQKRNSKDTIKIGKNRLKTCLYKIFSELEEQDDATR